MNQIAYLKCTKVKEPEQLKDFSYFGGNFVDSQKYQNKKTLTTQKPVKILACKTQGATASGDSPVLASNDLIGQHYVTRLYL
ncbi:hypothetical protein YQE_12308, partial [Dendroctonus ponderosae]